jgi:hypothetical protein
VLRQIVPYAKSIITVKYEVTSINKNEIHVTILHGVIVLNYIIMSECNKSVRSFGGTRKKMVKKPVKVILKSGYFFFNFLKHIIHCNIYLVFIN